MSEAAPPGGAARGLDPRAAAVLAYSAWWVTGALFLLIERHDARVRFHAAQSLIVFGAISGVIALAYVAALPLMLISAPAARVALWLANLAWLTGAALWVWLVYTAVRGEQWAVPGANAAIARLAARAA